MKKISLYAGGLGLTLILIGLFWSGSSWQRIQNDLQHISQKDYKQQSATFDAEPVKHVKVNVDNVRVAIQAQTDSSHVGVAYFSSSDDSFAVTKSKDTVSVSRAKAAESHFMCFFRCIKKTSTITIYVPATSKYSYDLTADNEDVVFENASNLQTQSVQIVSSNSRVKAQHMIVDGTINISSDNGSVELRNVQVSNEVTLRNSNAMSTLAYVQAQNIKTQTDNGGVRLDGIKADTMDASASNAAIVLNKLDVRHSVLTSDNGSVEGNLLGSKNEYSTKIESSNGNIQLDGVKHDGAYFSESKMGKSLSIQSSNGSVVLSFTK